MLHDAADTFLAGGVVMWPLLAVSGALWFLMAWWWWSLAAIAGTIDRLARRAREAYACGGAAACAAALRASDGELGEALARAVTSHARPSSGDMTAAVGAAEAGIADAGSYVEALVKVAPLLGLLGTVYGMVNTFEVLRGAVGADPRAFADGIRCALVTTQAGLLIALPGLYGHEWLSRRRRRVGAELRRAVYAISRLGC